MTTLRALALLVVLVVLAAGCQGLSDVDVDLGGAGEDGEQQAAPPEGSDGDAPAGEPPGAAPQGEAAEGGSSNAGASEPGASDGGASQPAAPAVPDDRAGLGAMCRTYLRGQVPRLVVEVDHQAGAQPTQAAVDHLLATLRGVVDKPGGVVLAGGNEIPGGARTWTVEALRATAREHRSQHSSPEQVVMYVLAVGGESDGDAIGLTFNATEMAIFPDKVGGLASLVGGRAALERAVLVHEAGHLLCLLNIGYRSALDHEDPQHPHHSRDRSSVMYYAVETSAVAQVFNGPPPAAFTANDRADLDGLRTGRY